LLWSVLMMLGQASGTLSRFWLKLCCCAICLYFAGVLQVSGMRVYTSGDVEAVNGTDVRLKCTFHTSAPINANSLTISWSFRPLVPGREESVFHYQQKPYPPVEGIFRKRVAWAGDIMGRDASIIIRQVKFTYNGTYICQVKNPPDVHGTVGEIRLRVVTTAHIHFLGFLFPLPRRLCFQLFVGLFFRQQDYTKSTEPIYTKTWWRDGA
uniref:Myelin protein zero like 2 n=1 Tax=Seriola lalandi dorsalis TaxID=1841481 RepID=A0A3B4X5S1_SERLL